MWQRNLVRFNQPTRLAARQLGTRQIPKGSLAALDVPTIPRNVVLMRTISTVSTSKYSGLHSYHSAQNICIRTTVCKGLAHYSTTVRTGSKYDAIVARAESSLELIYGLDWQSIMWEAFDELDDILNVYRPLYEPEDDSESAKKAQALMKEVYYTKEASRLTFLFAEYLRETMRDVMDLSGPMGNKSTRVDPNLMTKLNHSIEDYEKFVDSIESDRARLKVESDLGTKIIQLRQTCNIKGYSERHPAVATDHVLTKDY